MAKKGTSTNLSVYIEILQNGEIMTDYSVRAKGNRSLKLTSKPKKELSIPFYPVPETEYEFLKLERGSVSLIANHKWDGFCLSAGELCHIDKGEKGARKFELHRGDYGSLSYEDLRILVKVEPTPPKKSAAAKRKLQRRYKGKFISFFVENKYEWRAFFGATLCVAFLGASFIGGLMLRPSPKIETLSDLPTNYIVPFLSPEHIVTAPEALQGHLSRERLIQKTVDYYNGFTALLLGWRHSHSEMFFENSLANLDELNRNHRKKIREITERQKGLDKSSLANDKTAQLLIPAVVGESARGKILRTLDKVDIAHKNFQYSLNSKRFTTKNFSADGAYDYEKYTNVIAENEVTERLKLIKLVKETNESMMYRKARDLAQISNRTRKGILERQGDNTLTASQDQPIGLPGGVRFSSFVDEFNLTSAGLKIYQMEGKQYKPTAPQPVKDAAEPLTGHIDKTLVEKVVRQNLFQIKLCYDLALRRNENAEGLMEWKWQINSRGRTSNVDLIKSTIQDPKLRQCIRKKISSWSFPRPDKGSVEISYPFEFSPNRG